MKNILRVECYKALRGKAFLITLALAFLVTLPSSLYIIDNYWLHLEEMLIYTSENPSLEFFSLYSSWIGGEHMSISSSLFYLLIPLIAVFPYGWSYCSERKSGYHRAMISRVGKFNYFAAKYAAVFLSGALSVGIPLVLNYMITAAYIPAITPDPFYDIYTAVGKGQMGFTLFFTAPLVYNLIYILLSFIFGGLIASVALALSLFIRNRFAVVLLPFLLLLSLNFLEERNFQGFATMSPLYFLRGYAVQGFAVWWVILLFALGMLLSLPLVLGIGSKHDVL